MTEGGDVQWEAPLAGMARERACTGAKASTPRSAVFQCRRGSPCTGHRRRWRASQQRPLPMTFVVNRRQKQRLWRKTHRDQRPPKLPASRECNGRQTDSRDARRLCIPCYRTSLRLRTSTIVHLNHNSSTPHRHLPRHRMSKGCAHRTRKQTRVNSALVPGPPGPRRHPPRKP